MAKKNQHVVPFGNGWVVKSAGTVRWTIITRRQSEAIQIAKKIAQTDRTDLIVHGRDGRVRSHHSYSKV